MANAIGVLMANSTHMRMAGARSASIFDRLAGQNHVLQIAHEHQAKTEGNRRVKHGHRKLKCRRTCDPRVDGEPDPEQRHKNEEPQ